jgi:hypothetical protein
VVIELLCLCDCYSEISNAICSLQQLSQRRVQLSHKKIESVIDKTKSSIESSLRKSKVSE